MPQETDRLKLPLPLGNENVTRESINGIFEKIDAGVATQTDLDTLREAVSKMDIPDASLTQKGKVQLSSKTDGTSEAVAATEKAVRDARVAAQDNAKSYVDAKTWQKHKLTADDGKSQLISGTDLNSLVANGQYNGNSLSNAPSPTNVDEWWYIDVQCHSNGSGYVIQRASRLNGGTQTLYHRTRENNIWQPWSLDVFQSGVDAKNGIVGAINAKGGSASTNDTWATLAAKVNNIQTGAKYVTGIVTPGPYGLHFDSGNNNYISAEITVTGLSFRPTRIIVRPENWGVTGSTYRSINVYDASIFNVAPNASGTTYNFHQYIEYESSTGSQYVRTTDVWQYTGNTAFRANGAYVTDSGFRLPVNSNAIIYRWEAYGV
nr:pyocin knob domain-containing protein [Paenibacillus xylanexedens]